MHGTVGPHAVVEGAVASQDGVSPTKRALIALAQLVAAKKALSLDSVEDRRHVDQLLRTQAEASWRTLRGRYRRVEVSAREFQIATARAVDLVNDLFPQTQREPVAPLVRFALIAALTRRLVIDGPEHAEDSVKPYRGQRTDTPSAMPTQRPVTRS